MTEIIGLILRALVFCLELLGWLDLVGNGFKAFRRGVSVKNPAKSASKTTRWDY